MGGCQEFIYGGCEGNANRFQSLQECVDRCGPPADCPLLEPSGACDVPSETECFYSSLSTCLCQGTLTYNCIEMPACSLRGEEPSDADIMPCEGDSCGEIPMPPTRTCTCDGQWSCEYLR